MPTDAGAEMYRDPNDGRNNVHWAYNEHGQIKPLSRGEPAMWMALLVVVSLAAIALVVLERFG